MTRDEQLMDPRWQRKKAEMCSLVGWKCETCERETRTLHVHHTFYERGRMLWEYGPTELRVLCDDCHNQTEQSISELRKCFAPLDYFEINSFCAEWQKVTDKIHPRSLLSILLLAMGTESER